MCGSHYDTVPGGGQFDGTLGILSALEAVRRIREQGTVTERTIRLAAFKDEEGSRFGYGMVGSKSICGILDPEGLTSVDKDGISWNRPWLITGAGPAGWLPVRWRTWGRIWSFTSSRKGAGGPWGVHRRCSGIAGLVRYTVEIRGESGHAGATPMKARKDPVFSHVPVD